MNKSRSQKSLIKKSGMDLPGNTSVDARFESPQEMSQKHRKGSLKLQFGQYGPCKRAISIAGVKI